MKFQQKLFYVILGALLATGFSKMGVPVFAAQIEAAFNTVNISIDGSKIAKVGENYILENGTEVPYSITYSGTTYLPMRKLSELLGFEIEWDNDSRTVEISKTISQMPSSNAVQLPSSEYKPITKTFNNHNIVGVVFEKEEYYPLREIHNSFHEEYRSANNEDVFFEFVQGDNSNPAKIVFQIIHNDKSRTDLATLNLDGSNNIEYNGIVYIKMSFFEKNIFPLYNKTTSKSSQAQHSSQNNSSPVNPAENSANESLIQKLPENSITVETVDITKSEGTYGNNPGPLYTKDPKHPNYSEPNQVAAPSE